MKELFPQNIGLDGQHLTDDTIEVDLHRPEYASTPLYPGWKKKDDKPGEPRYPLVCARVGADIHRATQSLILGNPIRPAFGWIKSELDRYPRGYESGYNTMLVDIADQALPHIQPREGKAAAIISETGVHFPFDQVLEMEQTRWQLISGQTSPHVILEAAQGSFDEQDRFHPDPDLQSLANARAITGRNKHTGKRRTDLLPQGARIDLAILEFDPKNEKLRAALEGFGKLKKSMHLREFTDEEWEIYNTIREAFMKPTPTKEEKEAGMIDESLLFRFVNIKTHLMRGQDMTNLGPTPDEVENTIKNCNALEHFFRQITPPGQRDEFVQALYRNAEVGLLKVNIPLVSRLGQFSTPPYQPVVGFHPFDVRHLRWQSKRKLNEKARQYRERTKPRVQPEQRPVEPMTIFEDTTQDLALQVGAK